MTSPAAAGATEPFSNRPIPLIVPFPTGGGTDIVEGVLDQRLYEGLGQPVVIDIAAASTAGSAPALAAKHLRPIATRCC